MTITEIIISLVGGLFAGFLNSLAGFGSLISLAIYMDVLGLPGHIANATNRLNVMGSSVSSTLTFYRNGKLDLARGKRIIFVVILGALVGLYIASTLDSDGFRGAFKAILIPVLIILLINPKRFMYPDRSKPSASPWIIFPLLFIIGIYAGFIQAGFGVLFLIIVVMLGKFDLIESNGLKVAVVSAYTLVVIIGFHLQGLIDWRTGLFLTIGQALGGFAAARYASRVEGANKFAYYFLLFVVIGAIIYNYNIWKIFI